MRKSKLGIQALAPNGRALEWTIRYKPRGLKLVIVSPGDFVGWMHQIPEETFVVGRYFGDGNIDYLPWTFENAVMLAKRIKIVHDMNLGRIDAWECVNEPVVHTVEAMRQLAEFQRVWAIQMRANGLSSIVGNFSVGNPQVDSADNTNLMHYFRPAMEAGNYFAIHGYGCPEAMSHPRWQAMRYNELFVDAGMSMPVILTECGRDCGSTGHGYKEKYSDEQYIPQLIQLDQALQADRLVKLATVFCLGTYGSWKTFDLTENAGRLLGEYIVSQGDIEEEPEPEPPPPPPEEDIAEELLEDLDHYLPPWNDGQPVGYNPHVGLARAARLAQPPLGLPISSELRGQFGSKIMVYQFFWAGMAWCHDGEYNNIHIVRY